MTGNASALRLSVIAGPLGLVIGLITGLHRLNVGLFPEVRAYDPYHGHLMINSFLLTLVGFERAVALKGIGSYLVPIASCAAFITLIFGNSHYANVLASLSAFIFSLVYIRLFIKTKDITVLLMLTGSLLLAISNVFLCLAQPISKVLFLMMGFPLFTILGERIELSRLNAVDWKKYLLIFISVGIFLSGVILNLRGDVRAYKTAGISFVLLAVIFFRIDLARRTFFSAGITRFIAFFVLQAYAWLFIVGLILLKTQPALTAGYEYDALIHSFFLGFMFSMIFAHAPIIFPAIFNLKIRFSGWLYLPAQMLGVSLLGRIFSDYAMNQAFRSGFALLNVVSIMLFFIIYSLVQICPSRQCRSQGV